MNKKLVLLCSFLGWMAFSTSPLQADLLVTLPPGDFSCAVEVTPHNAPQPDPAHPERHYSPVVKAMTITRVGNIRRDFLVWSDGSNSQIWSLAVNNVSLEEKAHGAQKDVYILLGTLRDQSCPKLLHFDADSVSWITAQALAKDSDMEAGLHYQAPIVLPAAPPTPARTVIYQAWIDPKTLLPLKFDDGDALFVLTFAKDAPAGPLVMPTNMEAELKHWQNVVGPHPHL